MIWYQGKFFFTPIEYMTLNGMGLDFFGTMFMGGLRTLLLLILKGRAFLGGMIEKRHILVNLGQI